MSSPPGNTATQPSKAPTSAPSTSTKKSKPPLRRNGAQVNLGGQTFAIPTFRVTSSDDRREIASRFNAIPSSDSSSASDEEQEGGSEGHSPEGSESSGASDGEDEASSVSNSSRESARRSHGSGREFEQWSGASFESSPDSSSNEEEETSEREANSDSRSSGKAQHYSRSMSISSSEDDQSSIASDGYGYSQSSFSSYGADSEASYSFDWFLGVSHRSFTCSTEQRLITTHNHVFESFNKLFYIDAGWLPSHVSAS